MSWPLRLFPAAWRERYGEEIEQLIADSKGGVRSHFDLIRGALHVQRRPEAHGLGPGRLRSWLTRDHLAGLCILAATVIWTWAYLDLAAGAFLSRFGLDPVTSPSRRVWAASLVLAAVGMALLLARRPVDRTWPLRVPSLSLMTIAASWAVALWAARSGTVIPASPYVHPMTLVMVGAVLLAAARTHLPRPVVLLLAAASTAHLAAQAFDWWRVRPILELPLTLFTGGLFVLAWLWLGWSALRVDGSQPSTRAADPGIARP
jgi:hypothetical protein